MLTGPALRGSGARSEPGRGEEATPHATQKRPNIVLIMDDDQSVDLQRFLTKTNAAIGYRGVTFDNSFVNYSLCCPSRSTMLTGQYAHNHGVRGQLTPLGRLQQAGPDPREHAPGLAAAGRLLHGPHRQVPERLRRDLAGHGSAARLERVVRARSTTPTSFTGGTYTAYGYTLNENGHVVHYGSTPNAVDPATYQTDVYSQKAADFVRRRAPSRSPSTSRWRRGIPIRRRRRATAPGTIPRAARATRGAGGPVRTEDP